MNIGHSSDTSIWVVLQENLMFAVPRAAAAAAGMIPRVKIIDLGLAAMYNVDTPITGKATLLEPLEP